MTREDSFRRGLRIGLGFAIPGFVLAVSFGVLARSLGWGVVAPIVSSIVVFSGSAQFAIAEVRGVDRAHLPVVGADHDRVEVAKGLRPDLRQVVAVFVAMRRAIEVGAGVGDDLDLRDLEFRARCVDLARTLAAEVIADARGREAEQWILVTDDIDEAVELLVKYTS